MFYTGGLALRLIGLVGHAQGLGPGDLEPNEHDAQPHEHADPDERQRDAECLGQRGAAGSGLLFGCDHFRDHRAVLGA